MLGALSCWIGSDVRVWTKDVKVTGNLRNILFNARRGLCVVVVDRTRIRVFPERVSIPDPEQEKERRIVMYDYDDSVLATIDELS